jgi:hypothetical protein
MKKKFLRISAVIVAAGIITLSLSRIADSKFINSAFAGKNITTGNQPFVPNDNQVCFYENDNYGGNYICLASNGEYPDLGAFLVGNTNKNWNDKISSVIIGKNACAIMYENTNGGGYCLTLRGNGIGERRIPKLSAYGFNDKASHIKSLPYPQNLPPEPSSNQVFFFEHNNFDGYYIGLSYDKDIPSISSYSLNGINGSGPNWNDKISSIKVGKYACATTWFNINYGGQRNFFEAGGYETANYPDLGPSGVGDKISSFKLRIRGNCSLQ